jgi:uncharacterized phosphosugar-binding protein
VAGLAQRYLREVAELLERISTEEADGMAEAARMMAAAIADGRRIFAFGCSHSSLPVQDLVYRAGGLALINPIFGPGIGSMETRPATLSTAIERLDGYAEALLDAHPIQAGDVLIIVSVAGRNPVPVEMALRARERGIRTIAVTSRRYTEGVTSRHSSGRRVADLCEIVLDNKVELGDALLEAEGVDHRFCPSSGVTSTALLHALVAATVEELLRMGIEPPILVAANVDGGAEHNARLFAEHRDRIFYL